MEGIKKVDALKKEIQKVIVGQQEVIDRLIIALLADGHLLIEGLPGLAKTLAVNTLAKAIQCDFKRIQFTPDLLPADLIGTNIWDPQERTFKVNKGPIFTNILLADEINRAPAKVQSALLEVMQERQVTIGKTSFITDKPFIVLATQNPIEHEGTYPLPEAQTDRFMMKIKIDYPTLQEEREILSRMATFEPKRQVQGVLSKEDIEALRKEVKSVYIDKKVIDYILSIVGATRSPQNFQVDLNGWLLFGASPRASLAFQTVGKAHAYINGRDYVSPDDIKQIGKDILRHRLRRTYEAEAEGVTPDAIVDTIFDTLAVP
jgi:MoxR-like ATPase